MQVGALAVHPLKSARPVPLGVMRLDDFGPVGDRRWMLVDAAGRFVTQRSHPRMSLLSAHEQGDVLESRHEAEGTRVRARVHANLAADLADLVAPA